MNLRESPAVKNKIKNLKEMVFYMTAVLFVTMTGVFSIMMTYTGPNGMPLLLVPLLVMAFLFYNLSKFPKFYKFLKNIENGGCIILNGKGNMVRRGIGRDAVYLLAVDIINPDGTKKTYESDYFKGKLQSQAATILGHVLIFREKISKDFFDKVLAEDFTVYVDIKNPKNYFVDISPLYIAAEQK